jgi:hypothetical protein
VDDQRLAVKFEQAFVPPHARTCPSGKNEGSDLSAALHDRIAILRRVVLLGQTIRSRRD